MPLDAMCIIAVKHELTEQIQGMKIDKIQQPERDVFILSLRGNNKQTQSLLISVGADDARVHLTEHKFENPKAPPMFCMLLRKHLTGARIVEIVQHESERVLILRLDTTTVLGERSEKCLIIEMIGRLSNLILKDSDDLIIDCTRRIGGELTGKRSVLPGLLYRNPPVQEGKLDPLTATHADFQLLVNKTGEALIEKWLISRFKAMSPLICREIVWRAYGESDFRIDAIKDDSAALTSEFFSLMDTIRTDRFEPWLILTKDGVPKDFSYVGIGQYETAFEVINTESFSKLLDGFYTRSEQIKRLGQRSAATLKTISTVKDRLLRKISTQRMELEESARGSYYRECGDILIANLHLIKKGQSLIIAEDFYSEKNSKIEIKLDPLKTPQQNAAWYYKKYSKAKNAGIVLAEQIKRGEIEIDYVTSVIDQIKRADNESDLNEIRNELIQTGYIKSYIKQKSKQTESIPHCFKSSNGMLIFAGRSNIQNDKLTLKTAARTDVWLHAQKIHGAHVIISCAGSSPDEATLKEAAAIAAYYSAARSDGKVAIDYTLVKNVKKPSGGRPGMVIYNDFKTILISQDEDLVNRLRIDK